MISGWITSAAIAAVLIAVFVYPWQRSLEHKYLLKKEKRELYRRVLRCLADMKVHMGEQEYNVVEAKLNEMEGLGYEAALFDGKIHRVILDIARYLLTRIPHQKSLRERCNYEIKHDSENATKTQDELLREARNAGYLHGYLSQLLRDDLDRTTQFLPSKLTKSKRLSTAPIYEIVGDKT